MAKAQEAFRTIGEVSDALAVAKHVLRFWEAKFPQVRPLKRGGGRRLYRPADVVLLKGIHHLLHDAGYTIKGVQRILRENGVEAVKLHALAGATAAYGSPDRPKTAGHEVPALRVRLAAIAAELEACLALSEGAKPSAQSVPARAARSKRA